ncbi:hypothetical protein RhiJN_23086 [Ceratobasidium sp. AG-Ba]|nr:hypothetical protein RhiJN_23086 [Ceratobasidium sp. AG-Ba]
MTANPRTAAQITKNLKASKLNEPPLDKPDHRPRSLTLGRSSDLTHSAYGNERGRTPHCNTSPLYQRASRAFDPSSRGNLESPPRAPVPPCSRFSAPTLPLSTPSPPSQSDEEELNRSTLRHPRHFLPHRSPPAAPERPETLATSHRQPEISTPSFPLVRTTLASRSGSLGSEFTQPVPRSSNPLEGVAGSTAKTSKAKEPRAVGTIMISVPSRWSERLNANHE